MASGGIRHDWDATENVTNGEDRIFPYQMTAESDIAGIATWVLEWRLLRDADDADADAVTEYTSAGGDITLDEETVGGPTFYVSAAALDTADWEQGRRYWHELWKESPAPRSRLSYGDLHVIA